MNACLPTTDADILRMWMRQAELVSRKLRRNHIMGDLILPDHMWRFCSHFCARELYKAIELARQVDASTFEVIDPRELEEQVLSRQSFCDEDLTPFFLEPPGEMYYNLDPSKRSRFSKGAFEKNAPNAYLQLKNCQKRIVEFVGRSGYLLDVRPGSEWLCATCIANGGDYASAGHFADSPLCR